MGHLLRTLAVVAALVAGAPSLLAFDGPTQTKGDAKTAPVKGSETPDAASAQKDDKAAATMQRMLDTGVAAYDAGKTDQAIRAFDTAIRNGGLSNQQLAKALYYRGLAYRKKGKPALAIPDLTNAAWLNDGLTYAEKQEAIASRAAAYRDAGVADVPDVTQAGGSGGGSLGGDEWHTALSGSQAAPSAPAPAPTPAPSAPPQATAPASAPQTATYAPARPPPPPPQQTSSGSSGGGFFDSITNMFGGSSASSSSEVTTSSIVEPPPAPATSAWSQKTEISTASPPAEPAPPPAATPPAPVQQPVQQAAPPPPAPVQQAAPPPPAAPAPFTTQTQVAAVSPPMVERPPPATAPTGKFHVQVASVRSRSEAYALSVRLVSQHGSEFGARRPAVEETVIGSMGTFYRVSVGPYASAQEPQQLCGSLRASGYDCLVITQ
jgi:hypothetical protein